MPAWLAAVLQRIGCGTRTGYAAARHLLPVFEVYAKESSKAFNSIFSIR